jgi:hypothetical protein
LYVWQFWKINTELKVGKFVNRDNNWWHDNHEEVATLFHYHTHLKFNMVFFENVWVKLIAESCLVTFNLCYMSRGWKCLPRKKRHIQNIKWHKWLFTWAPSERERSTKVVCLAFRNRRKLVVVVCLSLSNWNCFRKYLTTELVFFSGIDRISNILLFFVNPSSFD